MSLGTVHVYRKKSAGWKAKVRFDDGSRHRRQISDTTDVTAAYVKLIRLYPDVRSWYIGEDKLIVAAIATSLTTFSQTWNALGHEMSLCSTDVQPYPEGTLEVLSDQVQSKGCTERDGRL